MWRAWERRGMRTRFWWVSQKERATWKIKAYGIRMDLRGLGECRVDPAGSG
jgi:hypothetical protein